MIRNKSSLIIVDNLVKALLKSAASKESSVVIIFELPALMNSNSNEKRSVRFWKLSPYLNLDGNHAVECDGLP